MNTVTDNDKITRNIVDKSIKQKETLIKTPKPKKAKKQDAKSSELLASVNSRKLANKKISKQNKFPTN